MLYLSSHYLEVVDSHIHPTLVPSETLTDIKTIAQILPPVAGLMFECRLGETKEVDLISLFMVEDGAPAYFTNQHPRYGFPDNQILTHYAWKRIQALCHKWSSDNFLNEEVVDMWLEFDLDGPLAAIPVPGVFVSYKNPESFINLGHLRSKQCQATTTALEILIDAPLTAHTKQTIRACYDSLPGMAHVFSIGAMISRQTTPVKICISAIASAEIDAYLRRVGWPGSLKEVQNLINNLSPLVDEFCLQFDIVNGEITPKLGIECCLRERNPQLEPRWRLFLDYLVKIGQCKPEKKEPLLAWYGKQSNTRPNPTKLNSLSMENSPGAYARVLYRKIGHIKLVMQSDSLYETKAYLHIDRGGFEKIS